MLPTHSVSTPPALEQPHHPTHDFASHGPALSGWQSHQSHGQLTIVFYVDLAVRSEDIQVIIASTCEIPSVRFLYPRPLLVLTPKASPLVLPQTSSQAFEDSNPWSRPDYMLASTLPPPTGSLRGLLIITPGVEVAPERHQEVVDRRQGGTKPSPAQTHEMP